MNDDERLITRSLGRLADHAPRFDGFQAQRTKSHASRLLAPLLASACVVAVIGGGTLLMNDGRGSQEPSEPGPAGGQTAAPSSPTTSESPLQPVLVTAWRHEQPASCAAWTPLDRDTVVTLDRLDDGCVAKASRSVTTVFIAPYSSSALFGGEWAAVTEPWRTIDGHAVRRLASGPLMEMSSRVVDAVVCQECDQAIVVLGPNPETVRSVVESVPATH